MKSPSQDTTEAARPAVATPRILYVEDDSALRGVFAELLSMSGYCVDLAEDGQEGWERLRRGRYDLLITDNEMPRLTGLELVERARSAGFTLPIVMASGSCHAHDPRRDEWLQTGAVLQKPFTPGELIETIRRVLRASSPPATRMKNTGSEVCGGGSAEWKRESAI